jgi:hypothetical protein
MVTGELADFIRIEIERNVSQEAITAKLLAVGWNPEDIAEGLTEIKTLNAPAKAVPKVEEPQIAKPQTQAFDPYRESPVSLPSQPVSSPAPVSSASAQPATTFRYKVPSASQESAPLMPDLRPKSLGDMQNQVSNIVYQPPKADLPPPSLEQYQNKLEQIVVQPTNITKAPPIVPQRKSNHFFRTLFFIILILLLCGGGFYSYTKGYIKLPFEVPFLKKDPHQVLSLVPSAMTETKSFKSSMDVKATFPAVGQLIGMLMGGGANPSSNTDFINLHTDLLYSDEGDIGKKVDASITGTSSLVAQASTLGLRNIGGVTYLKVSDVQSLVPKDTPIPSGWISVSKSDIESLYALAKEDGQTLPPKEDKDAILNLFSSFSWKSVVDVIPDTNSVSIKENASEKIGNIDTHHYSISVDSAMTKKLIHSLANSYGFKFSEQEWVEVDKVLSAVSINTFDVWIGKNDMRLYKTNVVVTVPLTKVLNLEDKNLSANTLRLEFTNAYSDFNMPINIAIPTDAIPSLYVVDNINKSMKDAVSKSLMQTLTFSFGQLRDKDGSYGYKSNSSGSCANPTVGSLFSPTGHKKTASEPVAMIAENIIRFIDVSNGQSLCYSTTSMWAISLPTVKDNTKYLCADSTGALLETSTQLAGPVCK